MYVINLLDATLWTPLEWEAAWHLTLRNITDLDIGPDFSIHVFPIESALNLLNGLVTAKMAS